MTDPTKPAGIKDIEPMRAELRRTRFVGLISICGLTQVEAATILGIAAQTVRQKSAGMRRVTEEDLDRLVELWDAVKSGRVEGLPAGCASASAAYRYAESDVDPIDR